MLPSLLERLPNLFLIGAAKSGTTSLHAYLDQHPAIYTGTAKEPHFFDNWIYEQGPQYYAETFYPDGSGYPWRMDATPGYFHLPNLVIPRLQEVYGDAPLRFIVTLREPVARAWSHFLHRVAMGEEQLSFEEALAAEAQRALEATEWDQYFNDGRYAHQLRAWFKAYPREQFYILLQDDMRRDVTQVLQGIFAFLEIDQGVAIDTSSRLNEMPVNNPLAMKILRRRLPIPLGDLLGPYIKVRPRDVVRSLLQRLPRKRPKLPAATADRLHDAYREDILELSELLDRDLSHWLREPTTTQEDI